MSKKLEQYELEALKDGFDALTRDAPSRDIEIAFTDKGHHRVGDLISRAAIEKRAKRAKRGPP
jgi:hypothetical protein